ncbi:alkylation response protein AidB-like acyl-CoA dehydrogenase [Kribbella aluminosa]|uniref:Alkylation response protein AidB-like acyl-CoA dehydrogenase n=1 Tax=Kribbella aluminosa TaxID=416017 RepID=A0ABS4UT98_9ACTN|nr:acyl-CoA dehydrogenase family protein [Kribbella aluminosa]MBP2354855.1 alkylation response protein AidB-like acyl-CoA dehydrogenase [Kribbella aluminosa]
MAVDRLLPTDESVDLLALVRDLCEHELAPHAAHAEETEAFPRDAFRTLGKAGLLGLPYPEQYGGAEQPYEVYLQMLEEIASAWMSVGVGVSVHTMTSYGLATFGSDEQKARLLPDMVGGELLGAYALSEPQAGSDISSMTTRAVRDGDSYVLNGTKAWISHGPYADFFTTFARTSDDRKQGISAFHVPAGVDGLSFGAPERKMGLTGSTTTLVNYDDVRVPAANLIGAEGDGMRIALSALDSGRLGIAACAVGLAQAALDLATSYALERQQFGQSIADFQGIQFLLADMAAAVESGRATYLHAARRRDLGRTFTREAAIAKLVCTDGAMKVTTDAVQVLGGYGYTREFPAERYMREAKVTQIFEGTNQIQRLVISRDVLRSVG